MRWIAQTLAVLALNIRTIPQRLSSSGVAIIGIAGVVVVFVSVLSIAAGFTAYAVETKAGDSYLGVLAGETTATVTLKMPNGLVENLARGNITSLKAGDRSLMPEGLEEALTLQQMADLLEFVVQTKASQ